MQDLTAIGKADSDKDLLAVRVAQWVRKDWSCCGAAVTLFGPGKSGRIYAAGLCV